MQLILLQGKKNRLLIGRRYLQNACEKGPLSKLFQELSKLNNKKQNKHSN